MTKWKCAGLQKILLVAAVFGFSLLGGCGGGGDSSTSTSTSQSVPVAAASSNSSSVSTGVGTATLSWLPPSQNTDGSAVTDLAGYRILYGKSASSLDQTVSINTISITSYIVENLSSGTWYFAVVAINQLGVESNLSNVGMKTIG